MNSPLLPILSPEYTKARSDPPRRPPPPPSQVPSILPDETDPRPPPATALTAVILFAASQAVRRWRRSGFVSLRAVEQEAHVPAGAFSRLLGAVASLCQQTEPYPYVLDMRVLRNAADFELGRARFALVNRGGLVAAHVVEGTGYAVAEALQGQLQAIVERFLPGFDFAVTVPSDGGGDGGGYVGYSGSLAVLSGEDGIKAREERGEGMKVGPGEVLSYAQLRERFRGWLVQRGLEGDYDFFVSYRWTPFDEDLAMRLYNELGGQVPAAARSSPPRPTRPTAWG